MIGILPSKSYSTGYYWHQSVKYTKRCFKESRKEISLGQPIYFTSWRHLLNIRDKPSSIRWPFTALLFISYHNYVTVYWLSWKPSQRIFLHGFSWDEWRLSYSSLGLILNWRSLKESQTVTVGGSQIKPVTDVLSLYKWIHWCQEMLMCSCCIPHATILHKTSAGSEYIGNIWLCKSNHPMINSD